MVCPGLLLVWMFYPEGDATFNKLLEQGYVKERLKSSLRKFYGRYGDLIKQYEVSLSQMLNDILWPDHIQWQPPTDQTLYRTRPFTDFWAVSIEHLRRVWHADRGRLLLRTPGPVPFGICKCSFIETTNNYTLHYQFMTLSLIWLLTELDSFPWIDITNSWHFPWSDSLLNLTSLNIGFHWASATGVACWQGTLTPPDTWSRPFGTCICSTCWDQSFSELVVILPDYALRISLGTFSILLSTCDTMMTPGDMQNIINTNLT